MTFDSTRECPHVKMPEYLQNCFGIQGKACGHETGCMWKNHKSSQDALLSMPGRPLQVTVQLVSSGHSWHLPCPSRCLRGASGSALEPCSPSLGKLRWPRPSSLLSLHQGDCYLHPTRPPINYEADGETQKCATPSRVTGPH